MKAEKKPSYDTKRQPLADVVPLDGPFSMYIEPTRKCNLKCFYCMHATRGAKDSVFEKEGFQVSDIDAGFFSKLVKEIMAFPSQPKRITFSGLGDPLMNKHLPEMIKELRDAGFAGRIDVLTNGLLLTHDMSDALLAAGISRIQFSIQGTDAQGYQETCGVQMDFDTLIERIAYFYRNKGDSAVFIKIIDSLLKDKTDEKKFYDLFGNICDTIFIEHLVVMETQMGDHHGRVDMSRNLNNELIVPRTVCSVMFYFLQVNIDGETFPCSTPGLPNNFSMGNAKEHTLLEIWNGKKRNDLICTNLRGKRTDYPTCVVCACCNAIADPSEYLDDHREQLLAKFEPQE